MKISLHHWLAVASIALMIAAPQARGAPPLLDGTLQIHGFLKNQTHGFYNTNSGKDGVYMSRFTLWVESDYTPTPGFSLHGILRAHYDPMYDIRDRWKDVREQAKHQDVLYQDDDHLIREIYGNADPFPWLNLRVGRFLVSWGETDGFRLTDIVNPLDYRWRLNLESFEENVVPLWMARAVVSLPLPVVSYANLETIFIPNLDDPGVSKLNLLPGLPWEGAPSDRPPPPLPVALTNRLPNEDWEDFEAGARLQAEYGGVDAALFYFYTFKDDPTARFDGLTFSDPAGLTPSGINLSLVYPRLSVVGATATYPVNRLATVLRFESAYNNGDIWGTDDPNRPSLIVKKDSLKWVIGVDRPTLIPFINPTRTTFLSYQLFGTWIINHDRFVNVTGYKYWRPDEVGFTHTASFAPLFRGDTIAPVTFLVFDQSAKALLVLQTLDWRYSDEMSVGVGVTVINGDYAGLGTLRRFDELFFRMTYRF